MDVLLIMTVIGAVLIGYVAISRLDGFLNRGGFTKEPDVIVTKQIFLYGDQQAMKALSECLDRAKIASDWAAEPEMRTGTHYYWFGAFSGSDEDNLIACLSAKRNQPGIHTMAKCNDLTYQNVFKQTNITVVVRGETTAEQITRHLKG